jgi:hypothetical protein
MYFALVVVRSSNTLEYRSRVSLFERSAGLDGSLLGFWAVGNPSPKVGTWGTRFLILFRISKNKGIAMGDAGGLSPPS